MRSHGSFGLQRIGTVRALYPAVGRLAGACIRFGLLFVNGDLNEYCFLALGLRYLMFLELFPGAECRWTPSASNRAAFLVLQLVFVECCNLDA